MDQANRTTISHPGGDGQVAGARRILVVDDSDMQRRILSVTLGRWGYDVSEAATGDAALAICQQSPPDIVIPDWMMPGMSGPAFCRAFRAMTKDQ